MAETIEYHRFVDGDAVVREVGGWRTQVWRPSKRAWVDIDADLGTEARPIPEEEALAEAGGDEGEFAEAAE